MDNLESTTDKKLSVDKETYMGALEPYFTLVQNEYTYEKNRKQSLESRSGVVLSVLAVIISLVFERIKVKIVFPKLADCLTLFSLFQVVLGLCIYFSLFFCVFYSLKTIFISSYAAYNINNISPTALGNPKNKELVTIITTYRDIIKEHRLNNEKKAKTLSKSIISLVVCFFSLLLYFIL